MIGWSLGYDDARGHHGLGLCLAEPPERFTARMHDTSNPEADREVVYVRVSPVERVCHKVPGKMHYGERRPKCSLCGYGLGDDRWAFCPKCGARVERGA